MITNEGFTYTAYHAIPQYPAADNHNHAPAKKEAKPRPNPPRSKSRRLAGGDLVPQLTDLVRRLNDKVRLAGFHFQLDGNRGLGVLMIRDGLIVNRFEARDMAALEQGIHTLAGLQLSVVA